jgi:hypothetical protein
MLKIIIPDIVIAVIVVVFMALFNPTYFLLVSLPVVIMTSIQAVWSFSVYDIHVFDDEVEVFNLKTRARIRKIDIVSLRWVGSTHLMVTTQGVYRIVNFDIDKVRCLKHEIEEQKRLNVSK